MTVLKNGNRYDKSNVIMDGTEIKLYDKMNMTPEMDYIDYGVCVYEKRLFEDEYLKNIIDIPPVTDGGMADIKFDIALIQNKLSIDKQIAAHIVTKRFYEIGSPASLN